VRAYVLTGHGDLSRLALADVAAPEVRGPLDVKIRLRAAALNHLDLWTVRGLPGLSLQFPHVLGGDGAGIVEAVGSAVTRVKPGDAVLFNPGLSCYRCEYCHAGEHSLCVQYRLLGEHVAGTLAEFIVMPEPNVLPIPTPPAPDPPITFAEAAAFSLVTLTAWRMVMTRARVKPGETVLVWGIGGGVASTAMRVAKLAGAFVIATSSSEAKRARARELGADVTLDHTAVDVAREVRALTGKRGADVVIEHVGEATWEQSLRALGRGGRVVTCGGTTGPTLTLDVRRLFWYQWDILGSTMGNAEEYRTVVQLLGQGHLRPLVDSVVPLADARRAFERLAAGDQMGKVVVEI
jgi:NADPH:quinone reductase-like Zn-dependent oxidoreductase